MQLFDFLNNIYFYLKINYFEKIKLLFLLKQFHYFNKNILFYLIS